MLHKVAVKLLVLSQACTLHRIAWNPRRHILSALLETPVGDVSGAIPVEMADVGDSRCPCLEEFGVMGLGSRASR